jgi:hypothetical protein
MMITIFIDLVLNEYLSTLNKSYVDYQNGAHSYITAIVRLKLCMKFKRKYSYVLRKGI